MTHRGAAALTVGERHQHDLLIRPQVRVDSTVVDLPERRDGSVDRRLDGVVRVVQVRAHPIQAGRGAEDRGHRRVRDRAELQVDVGDGVWVATLDRRSAGRQPSVHQLPGRLVAERDAEGRAGQLREPLDKHVVELAEVGERGVEQRRLSAGQRAPGIPLPEHGERLAGLGVDVGVHLRRLGEVAPGGEDQRLPRPGAVLSSHDVILNLSARLLLGFLEECNPDASNDRAAYSPRVRRDVQLGASWAGLVAAAAVLPRAEESALPPRARRALGGRGPAALDAGALLRSGAVVGVARSGERRTDIDAALDVAHARVDAANTALSV